jgi:hypothetical protein
MERCVTSDQGRRASQHGKIDKKSRKREGWCHMQLTGVRRISKECEVLKSTCFIRFPAIWFSVLAARPSLHSLLRVQMLPLFRTQSSTILLCLSYLVYPDKLFFLLPSYLVISPCQCSACSPIHFALEIVSLGYHCLLTLFLPTSRYRPVVHSERSHLPVSLFSKRSSSICNLRPCLMPRRQDSHLKGPHTSIKTRFEGGSAFLYSTYGPTS